MIDALSTKDNQQVAEGITKMLTDLPELKTFINGCPDVSTDWAVVANWFKFWKDQGMMKVYGQAFRNFRSH